MVRFGIMFFFFFLSSQVLGQSKHEFFGVIKLNGDSKAIISYRMVFTESQGKVNGYSITNLGGEHETKNTIVGRYDAKSKSLSFRESTIIYTKSILGPETFCFVNFDGTVDLSRTGSKIEGDFKGLYENKKKCIDGSLSLVSMAKVETTLNKMNKKVNKSKKIDAETKAQYNAVSIMDSLKVNKLSKNQNLNLFVESEEIEVEIWDNKIEDGDRISLFHNHLKLLGDYKVTAKKKRISVKLYPGENVFRIEAMNEGEREYNTTSIQLIDKVNSVDLLTSLRKGEKASITIIKK